MDKRFIDFLQEVFGDSPHTCDEQTWDWAQENFEKLEEIVNRERIAASILQEWVDQQGHNRCWYYPDLFRKLARLYGVKMTVEPALPPEEEFRAGCDKYREEEYSKPAKIVVESGTENHSESSLGSNP